MAVHDMARGGRAPSTAVGDAAAAFRERLLLVVLYVVILTSSIAFIEPSPHDGLMGLLAIVCVIAGVRFERAIAPLVILLVVFNFGGLLSLLNVAGQEKTIQYTGTSLYLACAAILFAALLSHHVMPRIATICAAYILTAVITSCAGIVGYFSLFPHAHDLFTDYDRALGTFKDPNVFGPFLIWPALVLIERMLAHRIGMIDLLSLGIMLVGLLLSFSRGAWFHFAVSGGIMTTLSLLTAPTSRIRMRILVMAGIGAAAIVAFAAILLSFDSIAHMFRERAQLLQYYDVGSGGRFRLQELALGAMLDFPNGMGPYQFGVVHGTQQHNVYLQAFLVYGWLGGVTYLVLLGTTLMVGLRALPIRTPWQPYLICAYATFIGQVLEGFVIDTDHWRHFYLLLGMIWGLAAATFHDRRGAPAPPPREIQGHARFG